MDIFDVLTLIGGLCLFLFGMNLMGQYLERRAGNSLRSVLRKLTTNKTAGILTGLGVTAIIQSSSATTVMVVGFVNSGLMSLRQAINVIMGANIGTTVTAWILSLAGIEGGNTFVQLLKPTSFTPVLALVGIILYMFCKGDKKKDTGMILLGFATLMFGMDTMSNAVAGLKDVPEFRNLFVLFQNPLLGVLVGAVVTAIIQSSSASVGILQALSSTGQITFGAAIPIIMGQNIGTCVTAMISSVGANRNAKRAALVHLLFNIIGTVVWLIVFCIIQYVFKPAILTQATTELGIAIAHSIFNILCVALLLPQSGFLEKIVNRLLRDEDKPDAISELDERLMATPSVALERCRMITTEMATTSYASLIDSLRSLKTYDADIARSIREAEDKTDYYEDTLSTYLVRLSSTRISGGLSAEAAGLLKLIGDFERIADHAVNIVESAEELRDKQLQFSRQATSELAVITSAVEEVLELAYSSFINNDPAAASLVEPLEQVIDDLKEELRTRHILRLQQGQCSIEVGFVWSDLLTNLERTSDHCSNIAGCVMDLAQNNMNLHESLRGVRVASTGYDVKYAGYATKYSLPSPSDNV